MIGLQAKVNALRELQSATGEELRRRRTLLPSVLRPSGGAFRGELCPLPVFPPNGRKENGKLE